MKHSGHNVHVLIPLNVDGYLFGNNGNSGYRAHIRRRLAADFSGCERDTGKFDSAVEDVIPRPANG